MGIDKPRHHRGRGFRSRGRRGSRRNERHQRTDAEQLDYEMELLQAQREGRETEFKEQEREKLRERMAARLDAEMDDYFSSRPSPKKTDAPDTSIEPNPANIKNHTDATDTPSNIPTEPASQHLEDPGDSQPLPEQDN